MGFSVKLPTKIVKYFNKIILGLDYILSHDRMSSHIYHSKTFDKICSRIMWNFNKIC